MSAFDAQSWEKRELGLNIPQKVKDEFIELIAERDRVALDQLVQNYNFYQHLWALLDYWQGQGRIRVKDGYVIYQDAFDVWRPR